MKMVAKWYAFLDIGAVKPYGQQEKPFSLPDDERLSWFELDFYGYIEENEKGDLQGGNTHDDKTDNGSN